MLLKPSSMGPFTLTSSVQSILGGGRNNANSSSSSKGGEAGGSGGAMDKDMVAVSLC